MRLQVLALALALLPFAAAPAAAAPVESAVPFCPFITDFATICVGGSLDCFVSVRVMGGDRFCL
jgi:hypothetical protein